MSSNMQFSPYSHYSYHKFIVCNNYENEQNNNFLEIMVYEHVYIFYHYYRYLNLHAYNPYQYVQCVMCMGDFLIFLQFCTF